MQLSAHRRGMDMSRPSVELLQAYDRACLTRMMRLLDPVGAELLDPDAAGCSQSPLSMDGYQDLSFLEFLADTASTRKQAPSQEAIQAIIDRPNKQPPVPESSSSKAAASGSIHTAAGQESAQNLQGATPVSRQQLPRVSAALLSQQHLPKQDHQELHQAAACPDVWTLPKIDPQMIAWEDSVSIHLSRQTAQCSEHRTSVSQASEADEAQAFSRLLLLQGMQRVAAATKAMATYPPATLQKRPFGMPGDAAALDHVDCFKALIELDKAFLRLPANNHPAAVAAEALALWRTLSKKASSLPSFRSTTSSGHANGLSAAGKAAPGSPAFRSREAAGLAQDPSTHSKMDAAGSKAHPTSTASSSTLIQDSCNKRCEQQSAAHTPALNATSHHTAMIPEELLPLIYVTWEYETMRFCIPCWSSQKAAAQQASQGKAAEPAAVRRAREAQSLQEACADAAAKKLKVVDSAYTFALPHLASAALYMKAVRPVVEPFLPQPAPGACQC